MPEYNDYFDHHNPETYDPEYAAELAEYYAELFND